MGETGGYTKMGKASDTQWVDPTGKYAEQQANLNNYLAQYGQGMERYGNLDAFLGQAGQLQGLVGDASSPLQQSLNAIAAREAALGGEAALGAMPGAANSGAGMAAYGAAYADPFAKAQAQIAGQQLDLTGRLWGQQMQNNAAMAGNYASLLSGALQQQTEMASKQGDIWSPTYATKKGFWDYVTPYGAMAGNAIASRYGANPPKEGSK